MDVGKIVFNNVAILAFDMQDELPLYIAGCAVARRWCRYDGFKRDGAANGDCGRSV